jgi:hypothetical protein
MYGIDCHDSKVVTAASGDTVILHQNVLYNLLTSKEPSVHASAAQVQIRTAPHADKGYSPHVIRHGLNRPGAVQTALVPRQIE